MSERSLSLTHAIEGFTSHERTVLLATNLPRLAIGPSLVAMQTYFLHKAPLLGRREKIRVSAVIKKSYMYVNVTDFLPTLDVFEPF